MQILCRIGAGALSMVVVVLAGALPLGAQESKPGGTTTTTTVNKRVNDPSRRVPDYFGELGLTQEQRESIYKVRAKHQEKIDELEKQIAQLKEQVLTDCEAVLTDTQKQLLQHRRRAAHEPKKTVETSKVSK